MATACDLDLRHYIRDIPDFPKPGILFRDITPLLAAPQAFALGIEKLAERFEHEPLDAIVAAEARGFIFAAPLAVRLRVGFVPIRKPGKLPADKHSFDYALEYGTDRLEMHMDGVRSGNRVLVVDDLLATGGTVEACCQLVERAGATVAACAFLIELLSLGGAAKIAPRTVFSLIQY
ncbi:MAG TPA: adenine phosphoribosyltransferase [Pirellulaceae bacterium]